MGKRANKMGGHSNKGSDLNRPRTKQVDTSDARGQLGVFLRDRIDKRYQGDEKAIADAMGISDRAVRKWCEGESAPSLSDLDRLAKFLGYEDWSKLAVAAVRFAKK